MTLYTSDGNPAVLTIPDELPGDLAGQFDREVITSRGRSVLQYGAEPAGEDARLGSRPDEVAADRRRNPAPRKHPAVRAI